MQDKYNPRQSWDREYDQASIFVRLIYKYGVPSAIALFLVWLLALRLTSAVDMIKDQNNAHEFHTSFYLRAICITNAENAGKSTSVCDMK